MSYIKSESFMLLIRTKCLPQISPRGHFPLSLFITKREREAQLSPRSLYVSSFTS